MIKMSLHWTFRFIQVETVWLREGYLSKLNQIDKFKAEYKKLGWQDDFLDWFDSHGTEKCYLLSKAGLDKASQLHMSNEKVSLRNLKEYIKEKPKNTKEDSSTTVRDEDLLRRIKQRLNQDIDLEVSLIESKLRLLLIQAMEERDKNKRLQQLNLLTPTKTTN